MEILFTQERELLDMMSEFKTPRDAVEYLLRKNIISHRMCRILVMRRHYTGLVEQGTPKMDAITHTADKYCVSERLVQEAIYYNKDV